LGSRLALPLGGHVDGPGHQLPVRRNRSGPPRALARGRGRTPVRARVPLLPDLRRRRDRLCARPLYPSV
jgi:hypothetical protein